MARPVITTSGFSPAIASQAAARAGVDIEEVPMMALICEPSVAVARQGDGFVGGVLGGRLVRAGSPDVRPQVTALVAVDRDPRIGLGKIRLDGQNPLILVDVQAGAGNQRQASRLLLAEAAFGQAVGNHVHQRDRDVARGGGVDVDAARVIGRVGVERSAPERPCPGTL